MPCHVMSSHIQGSRSKAITGPAKLLYGRFFTKFTVDFDHNKKVLNDVGNFTSKVVRNKTAGYLTHLKKLKKEPEGLYSGGAR